MTGRPASWEPLAACDPAPGIPDEVEAVALRYRNVAVETERQADRVDALSGADCWEADAGRLFTVEGAALAAELRRTSTAYALVSEQLRDWALALREAQAETLRALDEAVAAETCRRANMWSRGPAGAGSAPEDLLAERRRLRAQEAAEDELAAARRRMRRAVGRLDAEAARVAGRIEGVRGESRRRGWLGALVSSDGFGRLLEILQAVDSVIESPDNLRRLRYGWFIVVGRSRMAVSRTGSALWRSGLGRYAAGARWMGTVGRRFPMLSVALDTVEVVHHYTRNGPEDPRFLRAAVGAGGSVVVAGTGAALAGSGVVVGATAAAAASGAVAAFGGGMLIGEGIERVSEHTTGKRVSEHWLEAAVGDDFARIDAKLEAGELLSDADKARLERLQTPWGALWAMVGR